MRNALGHHVREGCERAHGGVARARGTYYLGIDA